MYNILIIVCSGTKNRGTEALIRGTVSILKSAVDSSKMHITLASSMPEIDKKAALPLIKECINRRIISRKLSMAWIREKICHKLYGFANFSPVLNEAKKSDLVLVVGADNYDVAYGSYSSLYYLNRKLRQVCKGRIILYDCSLNKESVTSKFIEQMALFDAITVRESISKSNILSEASPDNLYYYPDPAFCMEAEPFRLPQYWKQGHMIGINLSSLIVGKFYGNNLYHRVMDAYRHLIDQILATTDYNIVLIPHVMGGADLDILKEIYNSYLGNTRINLWTDESISAPRLKYLISQCSLFVGARTHATIAAYSSLVPTLVLGYSTKSIGIAKDLLGTDKGWVIPVQHLSHKEELWEAFKPILDAKDDICRQLGEVMPNYVDCVLDFSKLAQRMLTKNTSINESY